MEKLTKRNAFFYFLFDLPDDVTLLKQVYSSLKSTFVIAFEQRDKNKISRVASPESVPIHLNTYENCTIRVQELHSSQVKEFNSPGIYSRT